MNFRPYDPQKDRSAVERIWLEVGWLEDNKEQKESLHRFLEAGVTWVAELNGQAECCVGTMPGDIRYLDEQLTFDCVSGVTSSRIARQQRLASRLTAHAIAHNAAEGALVTGLGMFEQGFYNRLGFGTGQYEHRIAFDPANLNIDVPPRVPHRLTKEDWEEIHHARLNRKRAHGSCNIHPAAMTRSELEDNKTLFGLGYRDESNGALTHHAIISTRGSVEHGPYNVWWMNYQDDGQFLELLGLLKSLGDQVNLIHMREPAGIQLQDLVRQPVKQRRMTRKSKFEAGNWAFAYQQMRLNDVVGCMAHTHLRGVDLRFNLQLSDPIAAHLPSDATWRGVAGEYIVTLGAPSHAERGRDAALPTLSASVNAWTRLWLGVCPATGLAVTDDLLGPTDLLHELDWAFRLPAPKPDWDF